MDRGEMRREAEEFCGMVRDAHAMLRRAQDEVEATVAVAKQVLRHEVNLLLLGSEQELPLMLRRAMLRGSDMALARALTLFPPGASPGELEEAELFARVIEPLEQALSTVPRELHGAAHRVALEGMLTSLVRGLKAVPVPAGEVAPKES